MRWTHLAGSTIIVVSWLSRLVTSHEDFIWLIPQVVPYGFMCLRSPTFTWWPCWCFFSITNSCFGACYRSSSPENPATSSRRFVLQPSFSRHAVWNILLPTRSESQADMMVGTSSKNYDIGSSGVDAPSRKHYYCSILIKLFGHFPWGCHMTYTTSCSLWILCSRSPTFTWWPWWCF